MAVPTTLALRVRWGLDTEFDPDILTRKASVVGTAISRAHEALFRRATMSIDEQALEAPADNRSVLPTRRSLLKLGGSAILGAGAFALAACETSNSSPGTTASPPRQNPLLDKWLSTKTAKLGVDLTFPPIQVK